MKLDKEELIEYFKKCNVEVVVESDDRFTCTYKDIEICSISTKLGRNSWRHTSVHLSSEIKIEDEIETTSTDIFWYGKKYNYFGHERFEDETLDEFLDKVKILCKEIDKLMFYKKFLESSIKKIQIEGETNGM